MYAYHICSDDENDYDKITFLYCEDGYLEFGNHQCIKCPNNCTDCIINSITQQSECLKCQIGYTLNSRKTCTSCGIGCNYCSLDEEKNQITCLACMNGILLPGNKCNQPTEHCINYINKESSIICIECEGNYILSPEYKCTLPAGSQCGLYKYNEDIQKYECLQCLNDWSSYIINTLQCLHTDDVDTDNRKYIDGCVEAIYDENKKKYECSKCKEMYTYLSNEKSCLFSNQYIPYCLEARSIDSSFFCDKYQDNTVLFTYDSNDKKYCYSREDNLVLCSEGKNGEDDEYICTKCVENSKPNDLGICECDNDFFSYDNKWCYKCDDENMGNPGCVAEKGCTYGFENYWLVCNECKEGYFKNTEGQCFSCNSSIPYCTKCHLDENEDKLICDSCDNIYSLNSESTKCLIKECEEYPNIAPGCMICIDKLDEYKQNNKCQFCKYGYFKTREESCVYCRSEAYGGPSCYECGYEEDEDGKETDNIICKDCPSTPGFFEKYDNNNNFLLSNNKCFNPEFDFQEICLKYELKKINGADKITCILCPYGFYLDSEGKCISFIDKIEIISNCFNQTFMVRDHKYAFFPYNGSDNIEYIYGIKYYTNTFSILNEYLKKINTPIKSYCEICLDGYFVNDKGECEILSFEKCIGSFCNSKL